MPAYVASTIIAIVLASLAWFTWSLLCRPFPSSFRQRSVAILVLGDIGRSPRMMYHAESFAQVQFETYLIGYGGSAPIPSLKRVPHVHFIYLPEPPAVLRRLPFILTAPIKITLQVLVILRALLLQISKPPEFILVQNPPSIPTLALVWLVSRLRGSKVIIDWHNLGYTILALRTGKHHIFVKIAKWFERTFGRNAYAHLFVTQAMHDYLVKEWDLKGIRAVLHDRPPKHFHKVSPQTTHLLFRQLAPHFVNGSLQSFLPEFSLPYSTPFTTTALETSRSSRPSSQSESSDIAFGSGTYSKIDMPKLRSDRPALIVSSTSWTPDEDFGILLAALDLYEHKARERAQDARNHPIDGSKGWVGGLPRVLVIVTGKGPQKEEFMAKIRKLETGEEGHGWQWVRCISLWLEAQDYPLLLGSADLGVSLHSSSSALDLPMKIVDMFGCGLPVCALRFKCLHELVKDEHNGLIFDTPGQLADQFENLLTSFPNPDALDKLRSSLLQSSHPPPGVQIHARERGEGTHWEWGNWDQNWNKVVRPIILRDLAYDVRS
ncbi:hypothetical protein HGRIS_014703 [Hohenbuehelia grisea]|uniref:Chitobiosyldiphosphodolichol beta-mannosyltransferase n=1 Tax=Hohenbuehelia grisea TaxID=104357 RepID=A0ABR3IQE2_9AGAR